MEILAPVGSPAALKAAIEAGADSVYLGSSWNARLRARNFTRDELARAISYCHSNNVKAYVTLNTLIFESELNAVKEYLEFLHEKNADAIIVQDLGVARIANEIGASMDLHASTQLSVHNSKTAKIMKELGFRRIVLARELNLEQIKRIKENSGMEIEVFGYGAMCYSYSGKCLWSFVQTGRSGNRGICAQMCRFPWELLVNEKEKMRGYLTSTKDLNLVNHVDKLKEAGVDCIKIEGRLKDSNYVRRVVYAFKKSLSGEYVKLEESPRGFTTGYLLGEGKTNLINPKSQVFRGENIGRVIRVTSNGAEVELEKELHVGDFIRTSTYGKAIKVHRIYKGSKETSKGIGRCILKIKNLRRNDTIYKIENIDKDSSYLSDYNHENNGRKIKSIEIESIQFNFKSKIFGHYADKQRKENVIYDWELNDQIDKILQKENKIYFETPRVVFDEEIKDTVNKIKEIDDILSDKSLEHAFMISELSLLGDYPFFVSHYANVTNTWAAQQWIDLDRAGKIKGIISSIELQKQEALKIGFSVYEGEYLELAISENDLYSEFNLNGDAALVDPRKNKYRIKRIAGNRTVILKP